MMMRLLGLLMMLGVLVGMHGAVKKEVESQGWGRIKKHLELQTQ